MGMEWMEFWENYTQALTHNLFVRLVLLCVVADTLFGCLRAVRYRCWNSSVGIDGGIRKVTMVLSVLFLALADQLVGVDLLCSLPEAVQSVLGTMGITSLGLAEFFSLVYILYEASSILKNMLLCGVPAPAGLKDKLAAWLDQLTDESSVSITETLAQNGTHQVPKKEVVAQADRMNG